MRRWRGAWISGAVLALSVWAVPADAAPRCRNTGSFDVWMAAFKKEAASQGISQRAISAALDGVTFDPAIIRRDSGQGVFQQSFLQFAGRMTAVGRYQNGLQQLKKHAALLARIEEATGVPPPVVVALWGLESDQLDWPERHRLPRSLRMHRKPYAPARGFGWATPERATTSVAPGSVVVPSEGAGGWESSRSWTVTGLASSTSWHAPR